MKPPVIPSKLDYIGSDFLDGGTPEDQFRKDNAIFMDKRQQQQDT